MTKPIITLAAIITLAVPAAAQARAPWLAWHTAKTQARSAIREHAKWKLNTDGVWDSDWLDRARCQRRSRATIDCRITDEFYVTDPSDPTMYVDGERCSMVLRVRRTRYGVESYQRGNPDGGDFSSMPCRTL